MRRAFVLCLALGCKPAAPEPTSDCTAGASCDETATCSCAVTDDAPPPSASCGCDTTTDLATQISEQIGVTPGDANMTNILAAAPRKNRDAIKAAITDTVNTVKAGGGLQNTTNQELNSAFRETVLRLDDDVDLSVFPYSNTEVTDAACSDNDAGVACTGKPIFTQFIINVHDFVNWDDSFVTVLKILMLHADYAVPVHLYITDMVLQAWVDAFGEGATGAILAWDTDLVSVSHHTRPPYPYDNASYWYDWSGHFTDTTQSYQEVVIAAYEALRLNTATGLVNVDDGSGGYAYLSDIVGYAPYVVTGAEGATTTAKAAANVYAYLGAPQVAKHAPDYGVVDLCTMNKAGNMNLRPESVSVRAYEVDDRYASNGGELVEVLLAEEAQNWPIGADVDSTSSDLWDAVNATESGRLFVNFKWHDNNLYMTGTPWLRIYANDASADTNGNGICNTAPELDGNTNHRDDFNGDGVRDVTDVAIKVLDDNACALKPERWDLSRGVDIETYETNCDDYESECGSSCGSCAGLKKEKCKETCFYVRSKASQDNLWDNYEALLQYVSQHDRFRVLNGDDLVAMANSAAVCP